MTPVTLLLILVAVAGVSALRWASRLAPLTTEFPAKTAIATLLAALAAADGLGWVDTPSSLRAAALVLGPVYVFAPLLLLALVRAGRARAAGRLARLLYWTDAGRSAVGRLLAQAAIQAGDASAALSLSGRDDPLLLAQARRLEGDWEGVVSVGLPAAGAAVPDNLALGYEARVEALLALGRLSEAEAEAQRLERFYSAGHDSPMAFRALTLATARLAAERGELERVRELLTQPMVGANPGVLFAITARAAESAGRGEAAARLWGQAYAAASGPQRERYAAALARLGGQLPTTAAIKPKAPVTIALLGALALAYLGQVLVDRFQGPVRVLGQVFDPSSLIAAYLQGLPGVPAADAWWRHVSYAFVHGNVVHVGFNLWVLFDLGRLYERRRGWGDLLAAFLVGTVGGALLTGVVQASQPLILVGASGGVLGIAGALLADALTRRAPGDDVLLRSLLQWMLLIMLFSVLPGVSLWGHAGGLAGGFAYGLARSRLAGATAGRVAGAASALAMAAALVAAVVTIVPLLP